MTYYYVYYSYEQWGRGYIGKRQCKCLPAEDTKYFGSFKDKSFRPQCKIILGIYPSKEEALEAEVILHEFFSVDVNPHFANRAKQTSKKFYYSQVTESHSRAISESNRRRKLSPETKEKIGQSQRETSKRPEVKRKRSESAKNKPPVTEETRSKLRAAQARLKGDIELQKRKGRPGRKQSEEHRQKRAEAQTGVPLSDLRKQRIAEGLRRYHATKIKDDNG
jgi:hypothetical protein